MLIDYEKTRGSGIIVTDCLNLRPDSRGDNGILVPVGEPVMVAPSGYQPLVADGSHLFITRQCDLYTVKTDASIAPTFICTLPTAPRCALVTTRTIWVMTDTGPFRIIRNSEGNYIPAGLMPEWPAISLQGVEGSLFEAEIGSCKIRDIADNIRSAYAEIDRKARACGQLLQPVVARVRIYDDEGTLLHVGPEVLVSGPRGTQLCGNLRFETTGNGDEQIVTDRMLQARGWCLQARVDDVVDGPWAQIAARADIEITPQFHPYDPDAQPVITSIRGSSKGEIMVAMPGCERGLDVENRLAARQRVLTVIEHIDSLTSCVHRVINPYAQAWQHEIAVAQSDVVTQTTAIESALIDSVTISSHEHTRAIAPHSFSADCVAHNGDIVLWGGVTPLPFAGWDAAWFAGSRGDKAWQGSVAVDFSDGSRVVKTMSGHAIPLTLTAILSYPLPSATRITISVLPDGDTLPYVVTVPLAPDASGLRSVWIADDLQPVALDTPQPYSIPDMVASHRNQPWLATAHTHSATAIRAHLCQGFNLLTIAPASTSYSSVENPQCRFYALRRDAIDLISVGAGGSSLAASFLTAANISSPSCATAMNNAVYVIADNRLLELKGLGVNVLADNIEATALVADDAEGEVLAVNADDNECVHIMLRNGMRRYHSSLAIAGVVVGRYAVIADGIVDLCRRRVAKATPIVWRATNLTSAGTNVAVKGMEWSVKATAVKGTLSIERLWLTSLVRHPASMAAVNIDGTLAAPVSVPLNSHPAREIALAIHATVSPDFAMTYPKITV